mmetsp:Transcript_52021/g.166628  ORF Transcript_52021/g.166628 Transcript_52021/m.166628 type:complete len:104 (-) Transcript_52021:246-557(-)
MRCADIDTRDACVDVGSMCAGWGGDSCLEHGSSAILITDKEVCAKSQQLLGIPSSGWGGSSCLTADSECHEITDQDICAKASAALRVARHSNSSRMRMPAPTP